MALVQLIKAGTMSNLHDRLTDHVIHSPDSVPTAGTSCAVANLIGYSPRMVWEYDLSTLWLTATRWRKLVSQYLNQEELDHWLNLIESRLRKRRANIAVMRTNEVEGNTDRSIVTRRFGSCMNYISYTSRPTPQVTLDSRTCYLGYMSGLDLTFAYRCGQLAAEAAGLPCEDVTFVWRLGLAQFSSEKGMGFLLERGIDDYLSFDRSPALGIRRINETVNYLEGVDRQGLPYEEMRFASRRRLRQRYHLIRYGVDYSAQFGDVLLSFPSLNSDRLEL